MVSTDPIADLLTAIRNALAVNKSTISVPYSRLKHTILIELKGSGYIDDVSIDDSAQFKRLSVVIHGDEQAPRINSIARVSKPGRRIYSKASAIPKVKSGRGLVLVSTSKGVMDGRSAAKQHLGGEVICEVY